MAGVPGFEPGITIPKTDALPLGHTPAFQEELTSKRNERYTFFFKIATP